MNRMPHIPHILHDQLRTLQDPSPTIPPRVLPHEGTMRVLEIRVLDRLPDVVDFVGREGDLHVDRYTSVYVSELRPVPKDIKNLKGEEEEEGKGNRQNSDNST